MRVPNIFHFIFLVDARFGAIEFSLNHYLAIKSAFELNQPDKIFFHCNKEPETQWFEKARPFLSINKVTPPKEIFGNTLYHPAHQADILRLEALLEHGGIYLDLDTICVKSLHPLRHHAFAIGKQYDEILPPLRRRIKKSIRTLNFEYLKRPIRGLCNAVILSEPDSFFIKKWYENYKTFRSKGHDEYWDEHSVVLTLQLAKQYPDHITILAPDYFHYPLYDNKGLKQLFEEKQHFKNAFVHHLWESKSWDKYLNHLEVDKILTEDTTYNLIARKYL